MIYERYLLFFQNNNIKIRENGHLGDGIISGWHESKISCYIVSIPWGVNETFAPPRLNEYSISTLSCICNFNNYFSSDFGILATIVVTIFPNISSSDLGRTFTCCKLTHKTFLALCNTINCLYWILFWFLLGYYTCVIVRALAWFLVGFFEITFCISMSKSVFQKNKMLVKLPFPLVQITSSWPWFPRYCFVFSSFSRIVISLREQFICNLPCSYFNTFLARVFLIFSIDFNFSPHRWYFGWLAVIYNWSSPNHVLIKIIHHHPPRISCLPPPHPPFFCFRASPFLGWLSLNFSGLLWVTVEITTVGSPMDGKILLYY